MNSNKVGTLVMRKKKERLTFHGANWLRDNALDLYSGIFRDTQCPD
jgi:hypothetical protein